MTPVHLQLILCATQMRVLSDWLWVNAEKTPPRVLAYLALYLVQIARHANVIQDVLYSKPVPAVRRVCMFY